MEINSSIVPGAVVRTWPSYATRRRFRNLLSRSSQDTAMKAHVAQVPRSCAAKGKEANASSSPTACQRQAISQSASFEPQLLGQVLERDERQLIVSALEGGSAHDCADDHSVGV
jgi:hypothetical protein